MECMEGDVKKSVPIPTNIQLLDMWKNRSRNMRCKTCMWFVAKDTPGADMIGRCRIHAPTMNGYPVCFGEDWCGDHKLYEIKL